MRTVPELDTIVVPIGGGGLIAGIAIAARALKPDVRIIGAEASLYASATAALEGRTAVCAGPTIAEGIAVKTVGTLTLPVIAALVERIVVVEEPMLERAVNAYLTLQKSVAEGAGAAGLAAIGVGLAEGVLPVRLGFRYYGLELGPRPADGFGHRGLIFQFETPFDLEDDETDADKPPK